MNENRGDVWRFSHAVVDAGAHIVASRALYGVSGIPQQFRDFPSTIRNIFNIVITGAGIIFVVLFLIGGVQYLTAAGNEDTTKKARQLMIDAVIGLGIVVTSWAIGTYILSLLGIQGAAGGNLPTAPTTIQ